MKIIIIVQARMQSTRLPGKVLKRVLDKPLLMYQIERLRRVNQANELVIATTVNEADNPIEILCEQMDVSCFRGPEADVLSRYYGAAQEYQADVVVRITSDCPLIDPVVIDQVINFYLAARQSYDYVSNCLARTYPRGMDAEVFSWAVLHQACSEAVLQPDREHVTSFFYRQPGRYRIGQVKYHEDQSRHRWTVDTPEDFELIRRILTTLYPRFPEFTLEDCLECLSTYPEWLTLNTHIQQKQYGE